MNRFRPIASSVIASALLLSSVIALATPAYAAYPLLQGQQINIQKPGLNNPVVIIKLATLDSIATSSASLSVSLFGTSYAIDVSNAQFLDKNRATSSLQSLVVGDKINVTGILDAVDTSLVHADIVRTPLKVASAHSTPNSGSTTGICASGAQSSGNTGPVGYWGTADIGLVRLALGCAATWTFAPPSQNDRSTGTPNQKLLWRVWYYGWAMNAGTDADKTDARNFLLDFFNTQERYGHYFVGANEALTPGHYEIWSHGVMAARVLAFVYHDQAVLAATGAWWKEEAALYKLLARGGTIDTPGFRFGPGDATNSQLRDTIYAMIVGAPLQGNPASPASSWWSDYYNSAAWELRALQTLGDNLGGAANAAPADLPILHNPLYIYTNGADYVYVFPNMTDGVDPMYWVASIGGQKSHAPYFSGDAPGPNPYPAPTIPGATFTAISGPGGAH